MVLWMKFGVVTAMTLSRVVLTALTMHLLIFGSPEYALVAFAVAALFDFDGFFARWWKVTTGFGELLDPLADKLLILGVILALYIAHRRDVSQWTLISLGLPTVVIALREGAMLWETTKVFAQNVAWGGTRYLAGLFVLGQADSGTRTAVSMLGKYKMGMQCIALVCLIGSTFAVPETDGIARAFARALPPVGMLVYWFAGYLTAVSGLEYLRKQRPKTAQHIDPILSWLWVPAFMR